MLRPYLVFSVCSCKNEFPLIQADGDATWRRVLSTTGWDVLGYGLYYKAKFISKSDYYKEWNPKLHKPQGGLGPITARDQRQNYDPHCPLSYYLVRLNDLPFFFYWFFFVYLLKLCWYASNRINARPSEKPFCKNDTKAVFFGNKFCFSINRNFKNSPTANL